MPVLHDATTEQSTVVPTARRATGSAQGAAARVVSRSGADMGPASLLALQRAAGNGAVAAMVARQRESSPSGSTPEPAPAAGLPEWEWAGIGPDPAREGDSPDEAEYAGRQPGEEAVPHAKSRAAAAKMTAADEPAARYQLQRCGAGCTSADGHPTGTLEEGATDQPDGPQPVAVQRLPVTDPSTIRSDLAAPTEAPLLRAAKLGPPDRRSASAADDAAVSRPVTRDDLEGHLDLLTGAALVGAPVLQAARRAGQAVSLQRLSLNPLGWAKKVWNGIKQLGSGALEKARSLGSGALTRATELGSRVTSALGSAVTGALSRVAAAARSGASRLGDAARSALQTLGGVARQGLAAAGKVARGSLDGALRLGRTAWNKASAVGRRALDVAMRAGRSVVDASTSLTVRAWSAVKGKVGGLWDGLKAKASDLRKKVMSGAQGLLAKAKALGGRALTAAQGLAGRIGGSICDAIGRATAWVYGKVAPLARQAWDWVKANPAKTIAMLLTPGGPLIALGTVLQQKMLVLAKQVFGPVVKAIAGKARAAWSTAKRWGAKAFSTAKQWAGKAWDGAKALGSRALSAASAFGRSVVGKAKSLGGAVISKAREWGGRVLGKAKQLGANVWGKAKELGGRLLGVVDSLTGGLASKVKGLAAKILGKASGVLSWVMDKAQGLASRALASARALASKVLSKAKALASRTWGQAKALGSTLASRAKEFAAGALTKGKAMLARAGQVTVDFGKKALQGAKGLAARALTTAKGWGSKAWATAKDWGGKAWTKAKELGGRAWRGIKARAGEAWDLAKGIGARLAPYARQAWEEAKRIGKAIGVDKAIAAVVSIKDKTLTLAKQGLVLLKNRVLPMVEKLRQARNSLMSYSLAGVLCKGVGCAYRGFIPRKGGQDLESGLDLATDIIPVVSTVKDTCTCLVGENFVTNKAVGGGEQGLACAFAALDVVGYVGSTVSGGAATAGVVGLRAAVKGGIKVGGKIIAEEALEALIKQGGRELAEKLGKEGLQELAEKLGKEGLQELAEKLGKEEFQKLAKEAAEQGVKGFEGIVEKGAKEAAEVAGDKGAKELDGPSLKETPAGAALCVQALTVQRTGGWILMALPPVRQHPAHQRLVVQRPVVQRVVVQRVPRGTVGDVCALLPKDVPKVSKTAIKRLIDGGGQLPSALVKDPDLLAKIARDPEATEGLCRLMQRGKAFDQETQKALVGVLAKHGDNVMPLLKNVKDGVNRLNNAEFKQLVTALHELPAGLPGLNRWVRKLNQSYSTLQGTLGEITYAVKLQGELAESGKKIARVADTIKGVDAGDIIVVTKRGKLTEVFDVKNFDWTKEFYQRSKNLVLVADDMADQSRKLAERYATAYGLPRAQVDKMVVFVIQNSPPKKFLDLLDARKVKWRLG